MKKEGGARLEAGRGDLKGDAFFKLKSGIHFTFMAALRCAQRGVGAQGLQIGGG